MAIHKLKPKFIETIKEKGFYGDGGNLYLQVGEGGRSKSWVFRYQVPRGGVKQMGVGSLDVVSVQEARERARAYRLQVHDGIDPLAARKTAKLEQVLTRAKEVTFEQCAFEWLAKKDAEWHPRYARAQRRKLQDYVFPSLGKLPVQSLDARSTTNSAVDLLAAFVAAAGPKCLSFLIRCGLVPPPPPARSAPVVPP